MATKKAAKAIKKTSTKKVVIKKAVIEKKSAAKKGITKKNKSKKTISPKTKDPVLKPAVKKLTKKVTVTKANIEKIDYFKLPFEVYYSEYVPVTQAELRTDVEVKKFSDIKVMHEEQGGCWGLLMGSIKNSGPELLTCIFNKHDEVQPPWLLPIEEDNIDFNYGQDFAVKVQKKLIKFTAISDSQMDSESDDYLDLDFMDGFSDTFFAYHLDQSVPDYLILDSEGSRIKVDLDGYVLDENCQKTKKRIFNPDEFDEDGYENAESRDFWDMRAEWIRGVLASKFPKEINLRYVP